MLSYMYFIVEKYVYNDLTCMYMYSRVSKKKFTFCFCTTIVVQIAVWIITVRTAFKRLNCVVIIFDNNYY